MSFQVIEEYKEASQKVQEASERLEKASETLSLASQEYNKAVKAQEEARRGVESLKEALEGLDLSNTPNPAKKPEEVVLAPNEVSAEVVESDAVEIPENDSEETSKDVPEPLVEVTEEVSELPSRYPNFPGETDTVMKRLAPAIEVIIGLADDGGLPVSADDFALFTEDSFTKRQANGALKKLTTLGWLVEKDGEWDLASPLVTEKPVVEVSETPKKGEESDASGLFSEVDVSDDPFYGLDDDGLGLDDF